jgi:hypothetical protein
MTENETNSIRVSKYNRKYKHDHKEEIKEYSKKYRQEHKQEIKKHNTEKIKCVTCGAIYTRLHKAQHERSRFHQSGGATEFITNQCFSY